MPEGPNPGQSYEAWIESKAGACPPGDPRHWADPITGEPDPDPSDWAQPMPPPYPADDEGLEEPRDA